LFARFPATKWFRRENPLTDAIENGCPDVNENARRYWSNRWGDRDRKVRLVAVPHGMSGLVILAKFLPQATGVNVLTLVVILRIANIVQKSSMPDIANEVTLVHGQR
jgi:hypothetical protein